ncbi:class I SAM-dependent methyltransferase [Pseudomonas sp. nanlin1]|uniref:class I SAM-dependent methyltransferase n=1 Tax=Pseudomonas sp. nanlin1 TaxID=3040605 RepID=UPI00389080B5
MSVPRPVVCLAPAPVSLTPRTPRILLMGRHQPTLLRCLDGWPRRQGKAGAFTAQFLDDQASLAGFADRQFDLAVVQAPSPERAEEVIRQLLRVARQGLITWR